MNQIESILKKHCPSMDNLFLDAEGRAFRNRIFEAMKEYSSICVKASLEKASETAKTHKVNQWGRLYDIEVDKESITDKDNIILL